MIIMALNFMFTRIGKAVWQSKVSNFVHRVNSIRDMQGILDEVEGSNTNNSDCIRAFKAAYCSKLTPKRFENGSKDFGNGNAACWKANTTCV
jgi:hypothetical protein